MIDWQTVITQLGGTAAMIGAMGYVASKAFESYMAARGEDFKAKLLREAEDHKSSLERSNHEHSVRFAALHAERAEVVKTLYAKVQALMQVFDDHTELLAMGVPPQGYSRLLHNSLTPVKKYFAAHRIFLSKELCADIAKLNDTVGYARGLLVDIEAMSTATADEEGREPHQHKIAQYICAVEKQRDESMHILEQLESEFRSLLGNS